jgi:hypothetical protein
LEDRVDAGHTTSTFLNMSTYVKNKHPGIPLSEEEEKRELQGIPAPVNSNEQYQGLGKHVAGLVVEKVPSWKHRKVDVPQSCDSRHAVEAN